MLVPYKYILSYVDFSYEKYEKLILRILSMSVFFSN